MFFFFALSILQMGAGGYYLSLNTPQVTVAGVGRGALPGYAFWKHSKRQAFRLNTGVM